MAGVTALSQFVGREQELTALSTLLDRPRAGRGGLAMVIGEPGIGKTALVSQAVAASGLPAVWARAREGAPSLWMWGQVLRSERGPQDIGARGEELTPSVGASGALAGSGFDRFRRFDEVSSRLARLVAHQPQVVVLDDLQWADAESLACLTFVIPDLIDIPLVVVGIARVNELAVVPRCDLVLELGGLVAADLRDLLSVEIGEGVSDDLVTAVTRHTGGSPLFVSEVARLLRSSGHARDPARWRGVVPEGVRSVLERRVARLPSDTYEALAAASVLGQEVDATVVAALRDRDRVDIYEDLGPAVRARLVHDLGDGRFEFAHALVRDAVYLGLDAGRRRALHDRAARVLVAIDGERAATSIAGHFRAAGDGEATAAWSERAGEAAYRSGMYADAAGWFERAAASRDSPPGTILVRLGDALSRSGRVEEANGAYLGASRQARLTHDAQAFARAALGIGTLGGGFEVRLLDPTSVALIKEALDVLDQGDSPVRAVLMARLSVALTLNAEHSERLALADEAMAMAVRLADDAALAYSISAWCDAHAGPAHLDHRLAFATDMLTAARRTGDPELELLARRFLVVAHMENGAVGLATRHVEAFAYLADALRQPQFCWYARLAEGMLALLHGEIADAQRLARSAADLGRVAQSANAQMLADGALIPMIDRTLGSDAFLAQMDEMNRDHPEASRAIDILPLFAVGYGAGPESVRRALRLAPTIEIPPHDSLYLLAMAIYGDGAAFVGDGDAMAVAHDALLAFPDRLVLDGTAAVCYGPVAATLGRIAAARGELDNAREWYQRAITILRRIGAPPLLARVERELADLSTADRATLDVAPHEATLHMEVARPRAGSLERNGDVWLVGFDGDGVQLRHAKGLSDLATLLSRHDREIHVLDLMAATERNPTRSDNRGTAIGGVALDAVARAAYEQRIRDLTEDIDEAQSNNDTGRAARLEDERDALLTELARALGLSGRGRPQGSDAERARKAVGMRIRDSIVRIERELPDLGRHLRHSIQTGTFCAYRPEQPTEWRCQS
jgi:tetratricopeptide (TPR) repeat protein